MTARMLEPRVGPEGLWRLSSDRSRESRGQTLSIEANAGLPAMKRVTQKRGNSLLLPPNQLGGRPPGGEWITAWT